MSEKSSITLKIEGKSFRTVKAVLFTWKGKEEMGVKIIAKEGEEWIATLFLEERGLELVAFLEKVGVEIESIEERSIS